MGEKPKFGVKFKEDKALPVSRTQSWQSLSEPRSGRMTTRGRISVTTTVRSRVIEELRRQAFTKYDLNNFLDEIPFKPQTAITKGYLYHR